MEEIWKDIDGYNGKYQVSNFGRVKSIIFNKERILKFRISEKGYSIVQLNINGIKKNYRVHRLVAQAFIPNPDNLPQINHKDENKLNNCVDNLEWCTNKYNANYGTHIERSSKGKYKRILQCDLNDNPIKEWESAKQVQIELGYERSNICCNLKGKTKYAYGYKWKYVEEVD